MRFFGLMAIIGALATTPAIARDKATVVPAVVAEVRNTPPPVTDKANLWLLDLSSGGRVTIWLRPDVAPLMVERIKILTRQHF